ncbi:MAG: carboxypeptidase-like regulatory domain-containing protein [Gemmatimonadaceae bacterium]
MWTNQKKLKQTRFTLNTETDTSGSYVACGTPVHVPLQVTAGLDSTSQIIVDLHAQNSLVLRRDIMLGLPEEAASEDSSGANTARGGTGVVRGKVLSVTGEPMENVRIGIDGVELTRTNKLGDFVANGVHAGTRTVAFVSIGSEPVTKLVDVPLDGIVTTSASMARVTVMEAFVVRGQRVARTIRDFEERKRTGFGSIKDSTELTRYPSLESALRMSRGVTIDSRIHAVYLPARGNLCAPMIFLDKRRAESDDLLSLFINDIAWIEVYPRWYDVPFEFQMGPGCGAVVIFTTYAISG